MIPKTYKIKLQGKLYYVTAKSRESAIDKLKAQTNTNYKNYYLEDTITFKPVKPKKVLNFIYILALRTGLAIMILYILKLIIETI